MAENKKKQNEAPVVEQKKVKTKYDLKMEAYEQMQKKEKKDRIISNTILVLVVLAMIAFIASFPIRTYLAINEAYFTINGEKVTKVEYDYQYAIAKNSYVDQYGSYMQMFGVDITNIESQAYSDTMTYKDYFQQLAVENIVTNRALKQKAAESGFTHDTQAEYDEIMNVYTQEAKAQGLTVDKYLKAIYGDYATAKRLKDIQMDSLYVTAFYQEVENQKAPTDEQIENYYKENANEYDYADYYLAVVDALEDEVEETAEAEENEEVTEEASEEESEEVTEEASEEESEEVAEEASEEESEEVAEEALEEESEEVAEEASEESEEVAEEATEEMSEEEIAERMALAKEKAEALKEEVEAEDNLHEKSSYYATDSTIREYVFSADRKAGDTEVIEDLEGNRYLVVKFVKKYRDEEATVDVYAVVVDSEEQSAEEVYNTWKTSGETEENFKKVCVDNGGTEEAFEGVTPSNLGGDMEEWLAAKERNKGDVSFFADEEDGYGYVFYYIGQNKPVYYLNIKSVLTGENMSAYVEEIKQGYSVEDPKNNLAYLHIVEQPQDLQDAVTVVPAE